MSKAKGKKNSKVFNKNTVKGKFAKKNATSKSSSTTSKSPAKKKKIWRKPSKKQDLVKPAIPGKVCPKKKKKESHKHTEPESKQKLFSSRNLESFEDLDSSGDEDPGVNDYEARPRFQFKDSVTEEEETVGLNKTSISKKVKKSKISPPEDMEVEEDKPKDVKVPEKQMPLIELIALKKKAFQETRAMIGSACVSIVADPQANIDRLKPILGLLDKRDDEDPVFKLALLKTHTLIAYSLLEVFRDILPGYRIRETAPEDESAQLKKETKDLRLYEASLLKYYKMYVGRMERMVESIKKKKKSTFYDETLLNRTAKEKICVVGVRCLSTLLVSHPYFNLRDNLVQILVSLMSCKVPEVRQLVFDSITKLYREDKAGQVSLTAVKATGKVIKALKLNVHPLAIRSFLSLNIKEVKKKDDAVKMNEVREKLSKMSRKEKKHNKDLLKLKNELRETHAQEDQDKKLKFHTEILNQIIYVYFRFMKDYITANEGEVADHGDEHVMTPVLEGLSKFAHLINIDFFDDVVGLLFRLIASRRLSDEQTLFCLNTVFTVLSGEGSSLNVDPQRFYAKLYTTLLASDLERETKNHMKSVDQCLDKMLIKRKKQLSLPRVLAFSKRLTTMALHSTPSTAVGYLSHLRLLLQDHTKADLLMDIDHFGAGSFLPELEDPEFCNANATRVWELFLLKKHYHPKVEKFALFHLNRLRNRNIKSELAIKDPIQLSSSVTSFDEDIVGHFKHLEKKQQPTNVKKQPTRYAFIDSPDSLTSNWLKSMFSDDKLWVKIMLTIPFLRTFLKDTHMISSLIFKCNSVLVVRFNKSWVKTLDGNCWQIARQRKNQRTDYLSILSCLLIVSGLFWSVVLLMIQWRRRRRFWSSRLACNPRVIVHLSDNYNLWREVFRF